MRARMTNKAPLSRRSPMDARINPRTPAPAGQRRAEWAIREVKQHDGIRTRRPAAATHQAVPTLLSRAWLEALTPQSRLASAEGQRKLRCIGKNSSNANTSFEFSEADFVVVAACFKPALNVLRDVLQSARWDAQIAFAWGHTQVSLGRVAQNSCLKSCI